MFINVGIKLCVVPMDSLYNNGYIRMEIRGWFVIIWIFMSVQINILDLRVLFRSDLRGILYYNCLHWKKNCLTFLPFLAIYLSWIMKLAQKKLLIVKWSWRSIELGADGMISDISETFSDMRFRIKFNKLHVWSCVHHFKYFLRWSSWISVIRTSIGLAWGVILSASTLLFVAWLSSYSFYGVPMR